MSTRAASLALALAPALLVLACGGSAPGAKSPDATEPKLGEGTRGAKMVNGNDTPADTAVGEGAAPGGGGPASSGAAPGGPGGGGKGVEAAVVDTKEPLGGGNLSHDDIQKILDKSGDVFGDCYVLGAGGKSKSFTGMVKVKATLGPSGAVNAVDVLSSTTKNPKVDQCVATAFKKVKFPAPRSAATSVITFPINFGPLEEVKR